MKRLRNFSLIFSIGAIGYCSLEVLWRGYTHWSMGVTGGVCFLSLFDINRKMHRAPWWEKSIISSSVITSWEFLSGLIVNRLLHWQVWDYSDRAGNILGQICPLYSLLWFLLSIPLCSLCCFMEKRLSSAPRFSPRQISSK